MSDDGCKKIAARLSEEAILEQLAEECGELVQQCAKRLRILRGENYTPVGLIENYEHLTEELVDVRVVMEVFGQKTGIDKTRVHKLAAGKLARWKMRLGIG